jgi:cyclopropane-fatty-acyl-phospholipid synthase
MNMIAAATRFAERAPLPDSLSLMGIDFLCGRTARKLRDEGADAEARFAAEMDGFSIAVHTDAANEQHYELPAEFFRLALGPQRKYSSCLYTGDVKTLAEAETRALEETVAHADLHDGQTILELGCGWGSLTLFMAQRFPASQITAVSNSHSQREHITAQAALRGLSNVRVITADMNVFEADGAFDRIVSVEMFEHMSNWRGLLTRVRGWLKPGGRLFLHVFSHRSQPYRFEVSDNADWIAQYFFTGGIMPSHGLIRHFGDLFEVEQDWRWSGEHYRRTAMHWLENFDANAERVSQIMQETYGADAGVWTRRWRLFFLATAGLFGHKGGDEWGVSHYRLKPA